MAKPIALVSVMSDVEAIGFDIDNKGLTIGPDQIGVYAGSGAPSFAAPKGSLYLRTDGSSSSTRAYICSVASGTWVAVTTAS